MTGWPAALWVWSLTLAQVYTAVHAYLTYQTVRDIHARLTDDDDDMWAGAVEMAGPDHLRDMEDQ